MKSRKRPVFALRTRLFLNLVPFLAILLGVGVYAILQFWRIPANVDATVTGNYRSVLAAQTMKLALTRMEKGVLMAMDDSSIRGSRTLGTAYFEQNKKVFDESLRVQMASSKSSKERDWNRRLRNHYQEFVNGSATILALKDPVKQQDTYKLTLEPALPVIDRLLDQIVMENQNSIFHARNIVESMTWFATWLMVTVLVVALGIAGYACYKLARSILGPIQSITRATRELGKGNLDQVVTVASKDELGEMAESFNKMAEEIRNYRQSTTEKILRLHRTMQAALASFPDPVFVLNREGGIELMNLAATELTAALELKDELPEPVRETVGKVLADGESFLPHSFKEVVSFRLNGQENFYLPRVLAMRNEENAMIGVAVVLYDVTRFRLLDDAKTNLVSTVSHEIRTPLTSVRMALHLLLEKKVGALTPRQNDLVVTAREDSERLLRILNDLLDLTRLEEGRTDLNKEKTAPADLVQSVADLMRDAVAAKNLKLICKTEPGLPAVMVDRQRINHVFTNLINNAIKYSPPKGEILLEATRTGDREVQFSVIDHGPGVPEDFQDRIFDRFYRVPGQTKTGAGLGLSIAREIAVAHGGRIGIRNGTENGSEFYFVLSGVDGENLPGLPPEAANA
jgi:NtrC-family two-component system sensor histidine kinase KinB